MKSETAMKRLFLFLAACLKKKLSRLDTETHFESNHHKCSYFKIGNYFDLTLPRALFIQWSFLFVTLLQVLREKWDNIDSQGHRWPRSWTSKLIIGRLSVWIPGPAADFLGKSGLSPPSLLRPPHPWLNHHHSPRLLRLTNRMGNQFPLGDEHSKLKMCGLVLNSPWICSRRHCAPHPLPPSHSVFSWICSVTQYQVCHVRRKLQHHSVLFFYKHTISLFFSFFFSKSYENYMRINSAHIVLVWRARLGLHITPLKPY